MAVNKYPWVRNLNGASEPLIIMGKVQAGSTAAIKRGEICTFNETSGYFIPADAAADIRYSLAIANEEQASTDLERYMEFIAIREGDQFEFQLAAAAAAVYGYALTLTASDAQKLTYDADGLAVAFVTGRQNYPEIGTSIGSISYAEVSFRREVSYLYRNMAPQNLKNILSITSALTLTLEHNAFLITNKGATQSVTITAPTSVVPVGYYVRIMVAADQVVVFDPKPNAAQVYVKGDAQTAGMYVSMTDIGDYLELTWDGTDWLADLSISGADADISVET